MKFLSLDQIQIRSFCLDKDDIEELTDLLHKAYTQLAEMGLRFTATHQDSSVTRNRIKDGVCLVGSIGERLVCTVTYYAPGIKTGCTWYRRAGVGTFGQFGVLPEIQKYGVGSRLLQAVEHMALRDGCGELALDTAEPAIHLHKYYENRGYRIVDSVDWDNTNYTSVIMSKTLNIGSDI